jgi:hypothetical protein
VLAALLHGPIAQPSGYHAFADGRTLFGIPNFWNVASNLPFLIVGLAGLAILLRPPTPGVLPELRPAYSSFFAGTALVAVGSGYYHLSPSNETLAWDRLPKALTFMAFLAILVGEHIEPRLGARLLVPLLFFGAFSVFYWRFTERYGAGDLRPYVIAQYLPMLLAPLILLLFPSRLSGISFVWTLFIAYGLAKLFEFLDGPMLRITHTLSGHSIKHLVAAIGTLILLLAMTRRTPVPETVP